MQGRIGQPSGSGRRIPQDGDRVAPHVRFLVERFVQDLHLIVRFQEKTNTSHVCF
jgi:hypothetical protein